MEEQWKVIEGFDRYEVSSHGRVRSNARKAARILKPLIDSRSRSTMYPSVDLVLKCTPYRTKRFNVHRLVALHFLDQLPGKSIVNHKDNNPINNHVENLEWCTYMENTHHAIEHGHMTQDYTVGSKNGKAKLTEEEVQLIYSDTHTGSTGLGKKYGVSASTVCDIRAGRSWTHVTGAGRKRVFPHKKY